MTFLEETFSAATAAPGHLRHQAAARAVLKTLLPESGTDIKGHLCSRQQLRAASGYDLRTREFEDLLRVLDSELRLITPTDTEGTDQASGGRQPPDSPSAPQNQGADAPCSPQKYYQLTHDYLVPSLRGWLTRKQRETRRGRAELRLAERAALWQTKKENRHLPAWWEWANIRLFARKRNWNPTQRKMMRAALKNYTVRGFVAVTAVCLVVLATFSVASYAIHRSQGLKGRSAFARIEAYLSSQVGIAPDKVYSLEQIQAQLSPDTALLAWLDPLEGQPDEEINDGQGVCLVRASGDPILINMEHSGPNDPWGKLGEYLLEDSLRKFSAAPENRDAHWESAANLVYVDRFRAVDKRLTAKSDLPEVKRLVVLPSGHLSGVPIEVLTDNRFAITYAPSATMFAQLREKGQASRRKKQDVVRLLALGGPSPTREFQPLGATIGKLKVLPDNLRGIGDGGFNTGRKPAGSKKWDIHEESFKENLVLAASTMGLIGSPFGQGPVLAGSTIFPGRLTIGPLPGIRWEVNAIAKLFSDSTVLLDQDASEKRLDKLAEAGQLRDYSFLHFAGHVQAIDRSSEFGIFILAEDPPPNAQVRDKARSRYEGWLTPKKFLEKWKLDADLVTLSTCNPTRSLYRTKNGDQWFAGSLLGSGARSILASLWEVDDAATSLLMVRFYQNLL